LKICLNLEDSWCLSILWHPTVWFVVTNFPKGHSVSVFSRNAFCLHTPY